jgi:hypothetical protein
MGSSRKEYVGKQVYKEALKQKSEWKRSAGKVNKKMARLWYSPT